MQNGGLLIGHLVESNNNILAFTAIYNTHILQARLQQYVNHELPDVQTGFRKGRGTRDQIANICWIIEKAREFQKISTSALLTMPKPLTVWSTTSCGKFLKRPPDLSPEKTVCRSRSNN